MKRIGSSMVIFVLFLTVSNVFVPETAFIFSTIWEFTVEELKATARGLGLPVKGNKTALVHRIVEQLGRWCRL